jgi:isopentenyl diphosphate isomerase/L-lactate dehydrogenase-like FMN-dependent dehydrogenase
MLVAADKGEEALAAFISDTLDELRIAMFGVGVAALEHLRGTPHLRKVSHN